MLAKVLSAAVNGIEAYPVEVEVNAGWGDTIIVIVGLPDGEDTGGTRELVGELRRRLDVPVYPLSGGSPLRSGR